MVTITDTFCDLDFVVETFQFTRTNLEFGMCGKSRNAAFFLGRKLDQCRYTAFLGSFKPLCSSFIRLFVISQLV